MALARALAVDPQVLLLDEPFGALDAKVREDLRAWLRRLHDEVHVTTVLVTHDQAEALDVADRIAVLNKGRIEQVGSPTEVYDTPANPFVMSFLGAVSALNGALVRPHDIRVGRNPDMAIAAGDGTARVHRGRPRHHRPGGDAGLRGARGVDQRRHRRPVHRPDHPRRRRSAGLKEGDTVYVRATRVPPLADRCRGQVKPTRITKRSPRLNETTGDRPPGSGRDGRASPHRSDPAPSRPPTGGRRVAAAMGIPAPRRCSPPGPSAARAPEPRRDHHPARAAAPQPVDRVGRRRPGPVANASSHSATGAPDATLRAT